jgi:outer membrane protein insertion porin family
LLRRYASFVVVIIASLGPAARAGSPSSASSQSPELSKEPQTTQSSSALATMAAYAGRTVQSIELPGVPDSDHLLQILPQKAGQPLDRDQVRESIRVLFATGRFADIQAEAKPSGAGVRLTFATSLNFFVGAIDVEGAPAHPNTNQVANATKLQLGELHTQDKLEHALRNVRQLMQENGYYRARVTAESTSNPADQQVSILVHITAGEAAHIGEVKITGHATFSQSQFEDIARMHSGDGITAARITNSLQRLRKKFQKQQRVLAQVSIAEQQYHPESNAVDYTYLIEPGPVVLIHAVGFRISRGVLKKEVPVYEENALDDDLLNEGRRNLLDYLQSRGHFDATVDIQKETAPDTLHVNYQIDPGPLHKFDLIEITGNKYFSRQMLRQRLQIQPSARFLSHGRYSGELLKGDVANLQALYVSNGFREARIQTKVDDNYHGAENHIAVHILIEEGPQTVVGSLQIVGNQKIDAKAFPELYTAEGQPYSEQNLANDRESILNYYFNHGFSNANLEITTKPSPGQANREDVTYTIQEGDQFFVNKMMVAGLNHTRDYVVQREIQVVAGQPLSQGDLLDTQRRLYDLGIFSQVDTAVQNPDGSDSQKNVLVQVQEAKRYTFTYGFGLEFETGLPVGSSPGGSTGVSPRVGFDVTRLNMGGRDQTLTFQSHVGRLQQRGLISYQIPKPFNNDRLKLFYTVFYDNSLDVSTFTSQRWEGKIDLRQQIGPLLPNYSTSITYRFDYRRVKASSIISDFSPAAFSLFSLPARIGGPGVTYIRDKRDNPLESTKGQYFTLDAFVSSSYFGSQASYGRILGQDATYYAFGRRNRKFVFARSTTLGLEQVYQGTVVLPPGACQIINLISSCASGISVIPLPEVFFAGGGNSHRGFGLNQAGPRDPDSGFPVGGTTLFVNSEELRFPQISLPYLGQGFGFAIFHDMGNVFTAGHDLLTGVMRWHQFDPAQCLQFVPAGGFSSPTPPGQVTNINQYNGCVTQFDNSGYDYTSHAVGLGLRYKTPIGPLRFDFGYNLNPTAYPTSYTLISVVPPNTKMQPPPQPPPFIPERLRHFNVFFSIGQPF